MRYIVPTSYSPCTIRIKVSAKKQCLVNLIASDSKQANTDFIRRNRVFQPGEKQSLYVQIPQPGKAVIVSIFEEGTSQDATPVNFTIEQVKNMPLARQMDVIDWKNPYIAEFMPFLNRFCFNAGVLPVNRIYFSTGKTFKINYVQDILTAEGNVHPTPMRIGIHDHVIEVAASKIVPMPVPERKAVLTHEMAHIYLNKKMTNEKEADINGLILYLGEGNPPIEGHSVYLNMFDQSLTDKNIDRYETVKAFIEGYEELRVKYV